MPQGVATELQWYALGQTLSHCMEKIVSAVWHVAITLPNCSLQKILDTYTYVPATILCHDTLKPCALTQGLGRIAERHALPRIGGVPPRALRDARGRRSARRGARGRDNGPHLHARARDWVWHIPGQPGALPRHGLSAPKGLYFQLARDVLHSGQAQLCTLGACLYHRVFDLPGQLGDAPLHAAALQGLPAAQVWQSLALSPCIPLALGPNDRSSGELQTSPGQAHPV